MIETLLANPTELFEKSLEQIIHFCGRGRLRDGSAACSEFRKVLEAAPDDILEGFAHSCLAEGFKDSGLALQDVMNELARRLGFRVEFGKYRGKKGDFAPDGVWFEPASQFALVVEVKTTDAYRISLDRLGDFRLHTCRRMGLQPEQSSTLVIVGRKDTGEFEAQIRGSRHAWSTRLVSVDALFNVLKLIETVEDDRTISRICEVLRPREYTRVDGIIDLAFAAAVDAREAEIADETAASGELPADSGIENGVHGDAQDVGAGETRRLNAAETAALRQRAVHVVQDAVGLSFTKKAKTIWADGEGRALLVLYSKLHERGQSYWYGYRPRQRSRLDEGADPSYVALVCGLVGVVLLRSDRLHSFLDECWRTERPEPSKSYWHIKIRCEEGRPAHFLGHQGRRIAVVDHFLPWPAANGS